MFYALTIVLWIIMPLGPLFPFSFAMTYEVPLPPGIYDFNAQVCQGEPFEYTVQAVDPGSLPSICALP